MDYATIASDFHKNGFGIIRGLFSLEELSTVSDHVRSYLEETLSAPESGEVYYEDNASRSVRCVFRMNQRSDYFEKLMWDPRLIAIAEVLFPGAEAVADGVMLIDKSPRASYEFPYHQDNAYQFWDPPEAVAATLALDEATEDNGTIVCLRGSHASPILPHLRSGVTGASLGLADAPDLKRHSEVPLCMKPGDLSLHHVNVVHRTGPNRTDDHRRNLGFAFHSSRAKRNTEANDRYQEHLRKTHLRSE